MMSAAAKLVALVLFACAVAPGKAQYLAEDNVDSPTFNNSLYFAGPGGYQEVLYEDATSGGNTGMVWVKIVIDPCGIELPQMHNGFTELSYILQGTVVGGLADPSTGRAGHATFGPGEFAAVPRSAVHSAENPSCTDQIVLLQAQSGGATFTHTDILTSIVGMSPSSVQYGLDLPNGQLERTAENIRPIFAWNPECLARCGRSAPAPGFAGGPTPTALAG